MADDRDLLHEHFQRIMSQDPQLAERAQNVRARAELRPFVEGVQESMGTAAFEGLDRGFDEELARETIVVREGRPVLLVENDDYRLEGPEAEVWQGRLDLPAVRTALRRIIPAIGRIEVQHHPSYSWVGTGWLVAENVIVTNRHVAEVFGTRGSDGFIFRRGWPDPDERMQARVDFKEEQQAPRPNEFRVLDILHIEDDAGPDVAFLRVETTSTLGQPLAGHLQLAGQPATARQFVATIGYPAADSRVPDQDLVRRLFGDVYDVKRLAPGQVLPLRDGLVLHDCSTLGGNSGSPIVDLQTGEAVGLHFSGLFLRENRGVPAAMVKERLGRLRTGPIVSVPGSPPRETTTVPSPDGHVATVGPQTIRLELVVPVEVSVNIGAVRVSNSTRSASAVANPRSMGEAVDEARRRLAARPEVLAVRDGFVFRDGWITDEEAVVVVLRDGDITSAAAMGIPDRIRGFPVEVRPAGPSDYAEAMNLLEVLEGFPPTTYEPPEDVSLEPVEEEMRVICHLCPDAGWPTLRDFLAETKKRLTIGMYDFTAPHIVEGVLTAVDKQSRKLKLVLQEGAHIGGNGTKKDDLPEDETIERYSEELESRFDFAKASVGRNRRFASAYHIKVAVRDGKAFWVSSGNWQSSNQPNHELANGETGWDLLMKHNREWNVVVENRELSEQFEAFLRHDFEQARADAAVEAPELPVLEFFVDEAPELERVPGSPRYFEPLVVERSVRVQPLLTPDNYQQHVLQLIDMAEEQILFQNQSFSILDDPKNDARFEELFDALLEKQQAGVDVRIIIRGEFDAEKYVERLKKRGFDTDRIRLQDRCHTKGIVVDRRAVLVGSHNWTNQGTLVNRDASLIFFDEEIAGYFAEAFWFDWKKLARRSVAGRRRIRVANDREAAPAGMVRVRWENVLLD